MKKIIIFLGMLISLLSNGQTDKITFTYPLLYPEGVTFDARQNLFFISSSTLGTIGKVDMKGNYSVFYRDSSLKSSFGMTVDAKNNQLLVCIADPNYSKKSSPSTFKKMSRLIKIDLYTGNKITDIDLSPLVPGKHFANDIAIDNKNNCYITDSYAAAIYKVDAASHISVFARHDIFKSPDVGVNGIVFHPKGFLIVSHSTNGALYKINIDSPGQVTTIKLKSFLPGADGLILTDKDELVVIQNKGVDKASRFTSADNWVSAEQAGATMPGDRFQNPTTGVLSQGKIYLLNSKMNELADSSKTPSKEFSIQPANFR